MSDADWKGVSYLKKFDSIIAALREVREQTKEIDAHDSVYLAADYWGETFYVTDNEFDLSEEMEKDFYENGCEPEILAEEWKVYKYKLASNKEWYPALYEKAKKPSFEMEVELIRIKIEIEPEYSLSFNFI